MTPANTGGRSRVTTALVHLLIALSGPTAPPLLPQSQVCSQVPPDDTGTVLLYVYQLSPLQAVQRESCSAYRSHVELVLMGIAVLRTLIYTAVHWVLNEIDPYLCSWECWWDGGWLMAASHVA